MASAVDLCNRALDDIGARSNIASLTEPSASALACQRNYDPLRRLLIRTAPWNFTRKQLALTQVGSATTGNCPFPWMYSYAYPSDCLKFRYMLQIPTGWPFPTTPDGVPQTGVADTFSYYPVSRRAKFLVSSDQDSNNIPRTILLTNLNQALGVYSWDCQDVNLFDSAFSEALVALLAEKLVMPLTGNVQMKGSWLQLAKDRVMEARVMDGNEGLPTTDHVPDWIQVRGMPTGYWGAPPFGLNGFGNGIWSESWDSLSWGE